MKLTPYPEYKDTGTPWIGKIPSHWEIVRNRSVFAERKTQGYINEELLSVTINNGILRQSDLLKNSSKKDSSNSDKSKYKLVLPNDIAYNKMRMWQGAVGISKYRGIVSPAYIVLKSIKDINSRYFHFLLRTPDYINESYQNSYGICDDQLSLRYQDFKRMSLLFPPLSEQEQIVRFLDCKLAQIAKFIKAKKRLIEVLKEQKQAVINKAVTKGLNPNAKMKPSGIDWLGDVPQGWEVNKLKRYLKLTSDKKKLKYRKAEDKVVFLPMEKISVDGKIDNSEKRKISDVKNGFTYFEKNDVVIAKITPCFENGKGAYLSELETPFGYGTTELIVLKANDRILPKYLYTITSISHFRILGEKSMTGSAGQKRIQSGFVFNFMIGIPQSISEQQEIIDYIEAQNSRIDTVIVNTQREIDLISEYRTRLISDVVTGKVDVRGIDVEPVEDFDGVEEKETVDEICEIEA